MEGQAAAQPLLAFEEALGKLIDLAEPFATEARDPDPLSDTWEELTFTQATLSADIEALAAEVEARVAEWDRTRKDATRKNAALHAAREGLHDVAERCRDLTKQIDLAAKAGWSGGRHRREGTPRAGVGPVGQYGPPQSTQGA